MRELLVVQHAPNENLAGMRAAVQSAGLTPRVVQPYAGADVPSDIGDAAGLVVLGGPMSVYEADQYPYLRGEMRLIESALKAERPVLGICLGSQLLASVLGSQVRKGPALEIGWLPIRLTEEGIFDYLFCELPPELQVMHWHGDVFDLPAGAVSLASSEMTSCQAFRYGARAYGILCHLEATENWIHSMMSYFPQDLAKAGLDRAELGRLTDTYLSLLTGARDRVFRKWTSEPIFAELAAEVSGT